jgi:general stress protein 26
MPNDKPDNYERVSIYHLNPDDQEKLLSISRECVFNWCTRDEWPIGVIMSCFWHDGRMWLTAGGHRHRIAAVRRNPKVSVVVTSTGTAMGGGKTITIKGKCTVHEDRETKDWFYPAFAAHTNPHDAKAAKDFELMLDSPLRVILEVEPEKLITYDGIKMFLHTAGKLDESQLGPPSHADTVRLQRELERRGLS